MERGEFVPPAAAAAAAVEANDSMATCEEEGRGQTMVACELEAATALAGLSQRSAAFPGGALGPGESERQLPAAAVHTSTRHPDEEQSITTDQHLCDNYVSSTTAIPTSEKAEKTVENTQLCSTSCQSSKPRPKLTEAEKETRKRRRVLANRESARQTIRRRQALYLELAGKATDLLQENNSLKKEKEVAAEEYNSLRDRNDVLKAELAKMKKDEQWGLQEDPYTTSSRPDESSSANSIYLQNQPSVVPCFWPSLFPSSSDNLQSECSSQGQENSTGITSHGAPLYLFPVPYLVPFQSPNEGKNADHQSGTCSRSGTRLSGENYNNDNIYNNSQVDDTSNENVVSVGLAEENREAVISPRDDSDDVFAAANARRRRKELMKMKNKNCYQQQTR